jgi:phosphogluconate 2-dehydrogenase
LKKHIVLYKSLSPALLEKLQAEAQVTFIDEPQRDGLQRLREALPSADGLLGASLRLGPDLLDLAPRLRAIASVSVGIDNYDVEDLTRRRVLLTNTPDVLTQTTADTGFALLLSCARRVVELAEMVKAGDWTASLGSQHFGTDVHGKTLGIIGMGRIGEALAQRGHFGFGMPILYHSHSPKPAVEARFGARHCTLENLLRTADFICLTVPLTAQTQGLIGAYELSLMKPSAILINIARGKVVDEAALIDALTRQAIRGAGLDVFEHEPLNAQSALLGLKNVVATPHMGSATLETREAMAACAVDNLLQALRGERPAALVNPEAFESMIN